MSAADATGRPSAGSAGRTQTIVVIAVVAVVIGIAAFLIVGPSADDGVTTVELGSGAAASGPQVGAVPPVFSGLTYDGKTVNLADYAGKPLWLTFGASWCRDCRVEVNDVQAAYQANKDKGLNLLAVFIDEPAADTGGYAQRAGLTFPIVSDPKGRIADAYRTMGIPTHFFIGPDGTVREVRIGALSREEMDRAIASILN